jgi:hypothetical protein
MNSSSCVGYAEEHTPLALPTKEGSIVSVAEHGKESVMPGQANSRDVVRREDGRWEVSKPGGQRPGAIADTQFEAIRRGSEILHNDGGGELRIHGVDGVTRDQRTIASGNDPYPPKG